MKTICILSIKMLKFMSVCIRKTRNGRYVITLFPSNVLVDIKAILIPLSPIEDNFNLRSVTWTMRRALTYPRSKLLNCIWKSKLLPKIKNFLGLVIRNVIPTHDFLIARLPNRCYLCEHNI